MSLATASRTSRKSEALALGSMGGLVATLLLAVGCADEGGYRLRWSFGEASTDASETTPARAACSPNGLDFVRVDVVRGQESGCSGEVVDTSDYPCHDGEGAQSLIEAGRYKLCTQVYSPARFPMLEEPIVVDDVRIEDGKTADVEIVFPPVPQCRNGLDDDGDGRIDLEDPQCSDDSDGEFPECDNGLDDDDDGLADLEDPDCSDASDDVE